MEIFQDYAYYYNLFYGKKDYEKEAKTVASFLKKYNPNIKTIFDMGCGTGRHDLELAKLGFSIKGIDLSSQMITEAKKIQNLNSFALSFCEGDIRNYKVEYKFDAAISLFHVMSYQNTNKDLLNALITANHALKEDGILLFDVWYGPGVLNELPEVRIKKLDDGENKIIRIAQPVMKTNENLVEVNYEVLITNLISNVTKKIEETHVMRYFFKPELEFYLEKAGFELLESVDCNALEDLKHNTWTAYFLAKKKVLFNK